VKFSSRLLGGFLGGIEARGAFFDMCDSLVGVSN